MMNTIKCLIVDDEIPATKIIDRYINEIPGIETVAICSNAMEALHAIKKHKIDLIFLDIQMPGINGIEFIKLLNNPTQIVLTTAYREYAVEGFDLEVLDYLVKPISFERFFKAIGKIYKQKKINTSAEWSENHIQNINEFKSFDEMYMYVRVDKKMKQVWLKEILYIESMGDYVKIITDHEMIITYLKVGYLEKKLPQNIFIRIHRGYLVARNKVSAYTTNTLEINNKILPIGGNYKEKTHALLLGHTP